MGDRDCVICSKHRGEGPLVGPVVHADQLVNISHRATGQLGHLFIESVRHVPYLDHLTAPEARAIGEARTRLSRGLRDLLDVERVQTMVIGGGVEHFHEHVLVRHVGTPPDVAWHAAWPGAPVGDNAALARRLAPYLAPLGD